jgi:hypothetical protein
MKTAAALVAFALLPLSQLGATASFQENFNFRVLDPNLEVWLMPGMSCVLTTNENGVLRFDSTGEQYAESRVRTVFNATGDFTVSVRAHNGDGTPVWRLGLRIALMDAHCYVYLQGGAEVGADMTTPVNVTTNKSMTVSANSTLTLEIERRGMTVDIGFSDSGGYHQLLAATHYALSTAVNFQLFAADYRGDRWGTLDDFQLTAAGFEPEPVSRLAASITPVGGSAVSISWPAYEGKTYQVQYLTSLVQGSWAPLFAPVGGTSRIMSCTDPVATNGSRYYRVVESQ